MTYQTITINLTRSAMRHIKRRGRLHRKWCRDCNITRAIMESDEYNGR